MPCVCHVMGCGITRTQAVGEGPTVVIGEGKEAF